MKTFTQKLKTAAKTFLATSVLATATGTYGDDTEVFYSVDVSKPNLLFVLDVSGSMGNPLTINGGVASGNKVTVDRMISDAKADSYWENYKYGRYYYFDPRYPDLYENSNELGRDTIARFRFNNLNIPQGAIITKAYIQFEAAAPQSSYANNKKAKFYIYAENTNNARSLQRNYFDIYGIKKWEPKKNWGTGDRGEAQQTPDLSPIVQRIVNKSDWDNNNGLAFIISGREFKTAREGKAWKHSKRGKRWVNSFDNAQNNPDTAAPELHIEYNTGVKSKLKVMQESFRAVLAEAPDNVKVGLMNYGQESERYYLDSEQDATYELYRHYSVSGVGFPVTDINAKARDVIPTTHDTYGLPYPDETTTIRHYLADIADGWKASAWTPIVDSLYEAALYYRGEKIHYGQALPRKNGAHPSTYNGPVVTRDVKPESGADARHRASAPKYKSPMESSCQENYIVLMTDGAPTNKIYHKGFASKTKGAFARVRNTQYGPQGPLASAVPSCGSPAGVGNAGTCGAELTEYLATHDNMPDPSAAFPQGKEGDQYIKTFTIGFGVKTSTQTYLKSLATYDDGNDATTDDGYFTANKPEELANAFRTILSEVAKPKGTLASPGYSVNVKNGLEHEKDIYIPVFDRKNSSRWSGNLKKFRLDEVGDKRRIRGKNHLDATDELGGFTSDALDYWSDSPSDQPDGKAVDKGGLASKLTDPDKRKIYSNLTGDFDVNLSSKENELDVYKNPDISNKDLGLSPSADSAYRDKIVNFMRGWEKGEYNRSNPSNPGTPRHYMGDMLHSEPLVITYNKERAGHRKEQYIFAGTNEGYLHAFDTKTGEEKFAFIPKELLKKLPEKLFLNAGGQQDHGYGVDGSLTYWYQGGEDGVENDSDRIIIYFGLRRGGSSYYALDVTNIDKPVLLWKRSHDDPQYPSDRNMGQSWSAPYLARIGYPDSACLDGTPNCKEVVIVSGGYDKDEDRDLINTKTLDDPTTTVVANVGNDIQIYNAMTGVPIWSMPESMRSQIKNSIPGGVRVLDTNYNGLIDRMYFADTGGNVWRLDLSESLPNGGESKLTKLAALGDFGIGARKFYNEPDVAKMILNGKTVFAVSIGSGFRAHPMNKTIIDNFFVLVDESPYSAYTDERPKTSTVIVPKDLADIDISPGGASVSPDKTIKTMRGWKVNFYDDGEKVLGGALTVDGAVVFTTLVPEATGSELVDQCSAPATHSKVYALSLLTGQAILDLNGDGKVTTPADISITTGTEILNKVQIVYNTPKVTSQIGEDGSPTGKKSCTHPVDIRAGKKLSQVSNYDACRLESVYWSDPQIEKE